VHSGKIQLVELLLERGADVNTHNYYGPSVLVAARSEPPSATILRDPEILKLLIDHGFDIEARNSSGRSALLEACAWGWSEIIRALLNAGARTDVRDEWGHTALTITRERSGRAYRNNEELLLTYGAKDPFEHLYQDGKPKT